VGIGIRDAGKANKLPDAHRLHSEPTRGGYAERFRKYKSDFKDLLIQSALEDLPKPSS